MILLCFLRGVALLGLHVTANDNSESQVFEFCRIDVCDIDALLDKCVTVVF